METFIKCIKASGETVKLPRRCAFTPQLLKLSLCDGGVYISERTFPPLQSRFSHYLIPNKIMVWFVGGSSVDGFSAIKMTALATPEFLVSGRCGGGVVFFRKSRSPLLFWRLSRIFASSATYPPTPRRLLRWVASRVKAPPFIRNSKGRPFQRRTIPDARRAEHIGFCFTAAALERPREVATALHLPRSAGGKSRRGGLGGEAGAPTDAGGGFHQKYLSVSAVSCIVA